MCSCFPFCLDILFWNSSHPTWLLVYFLPMGPTFLPFQYFLHHYHFLPFSIQEHGGEISLAENYPQGPCTALLLIDHPTSMVSLSFCSSPHDFTDLSLAEAVFGKPLVCLLSFLEPLRMILLNSFPNCPIPYLGTSLPNPPVCLPLPHHSFGSLQSLVCLCPSTHHPPPQHLPAQVFQSTLQFPTPFLCLSKACPQDQPFPSFY
jgi:hypothetical protein